jgi:hypothetical protein
MAHIIGRGTAAVRAQARRAGDIGGAVSIGGSELVFRFLAVGLVIVWQSSRGGIPQVRNCRCSRKLLARHLQRGRYPRV